MKNSILKEEISQWKYKTQPNVKMYTGISAAAEITVLFTGKFISNTVKQDTWQDILPNCHFNGK